MTIVCGDSHTSTHGAFGALAFGIGTSEVEHVLATQTLPQSLPKTMRVEFDGDLPFGLTAKDMVLAAIGQIGVAGGAGPRRRVHGRGDPRALDGRPDDRLQHVDRGRCARRDDRARRDARSSTSRAGRAHRRRDWERALDELALAAHRRRRGVRREVVVDLDGAEAAGDMGHEPRRWSRRSTASFPTRPTTPSRRARAPSSARSATWSSSRGRRSSTSRSTRSSSARARTRGSRICARPHRSSPGGKVADGVHAIVVPGSAQVKRQAEDEGLREVFESRRLRVAPGRLLDVPRA